jgi:hypothetical protein
LLRSQAAVTKASPTKAAPRAAFFAARWAGKLLIASTIAAALSTFPWLFMVRTAAFAYVCVDYDDDVPKIRNHKL